MGGEQSILVERDGHVALITLNRPRVHNALDLPALELLDAALDRLHGDPPRVLIVGAREPGFCAGIDLKESREATSAFANRRSTTMHGVLRKLRRFPAPVIAAIDGVAAGLGCELAISADIRLATPRSRFSYPEPRVAVPSPAHHLIWLIGLTRAQEMLLTARWIHADEAERTGLATRVVDDAGSAARAVAVDMLKLSPRSLTMTKENIWRAIDAGAEAATAHHIAAVTQSAGTADRREALAAFAEKREPRFTGNA
jgi:enoyl-CoA hydratase/carnithine racemase